ncbi:MAG: helix-turn-helix domain-containing protein [Rhodococcus qingshengii]|jgi:DNA-binding IclR family transcriptional regulator|uniref:helix-turn-helix domain-containing protein n=1 Tax=unclassified Rhodococcus (in: high G+C Gram-positive bacteria) TaxID=192944 RepID=UPI0006CFED8C|nr:MULTISPECIES: helix-turn-helix domain-containing protein [unclassified Rhodococcus (in: high G+C Gram-positive bacteria)]MCZ9633982.1 helix-turn-helix domain-containing protein [Rhodococcus sp. BH5]UEL33871.1 helix-turn-helix domain-containing protein [Rhodococcus sp. C1]
MARNSPQTDRIVMLTELLASDPTAGRSLADIARHLGVAKATCYPMVVALAEAGWLVRHPIRKTYQLGPALVPIGQAASRAIDVVDLSRTVMQELADTSELACLGFIRSGADLVVAEAIQPISRRSGTLGLRIGDNVLMAPPLGAGLAAWLDENDLHEWFLLGKEALDTEAALLRSEYEPILTAIRERGFAVECLRQQERSISDAVAEMRGPGVGGQRAALALREARRLLSADVAVGTLDLDGNYQLLSVNAVAFAQDSTPALILCLVDAPSPLTGERIAALGKLVSEAADQVTTLMHGRTPRPLTSTGGAT